MATQRETQNTASSGLRIRRLFTTDSKSVYAGLNMITVQVSGHEFTVPDTWPRSSYAEIASSMLYAGEIPGEEGELTLGETSVIQVIDRLVDAWRWWGDSYGYFYRRVDAQVFADELKHILIHQLAAPGLSHWQNSGLRNAYNLKGDPSGNTFFVDPETQLVHPTRDAHTHPVLYDIAMPHHNEPAWIPLSQLQDPAYVDQIVTGYNPQQLSAQSVIDPSGAFISHPQTAFVCGYLNPAKFITPGSQTINWEQYHHAVRLLVIALDISLLSSGFASEVLANQTMAFRPVAITNMGASAELTIELNKHLSSEAFAVSAELAKILGTYPQYQAQQDGHRQQVAVVADAGDDATELVHTFGIRHSQLTNWHWSAPIAQLWDIPQVALDLSAEQFSQLSSILTGGIDPSLYNPVTVTADRLSEITQSRAAVIKLHLLPAPVVEVIPEVVGEEIEIAAPEQPAAPKPKLAKKRKAEPSEFNSITHKFAFGEGMYAYLVVLQDAEGSPTEMLIHTNSDDIEVTLSLNLLSSIFNFGISQQLALTDIISRLRQDLRLSSNSRSMGNQVITAALEWLSRQA